MELTGGNAFNVNIFGAAVSGEGQGVLIGGASAYRSVKGGRACSTDIPVVFGAVGTGEGEGAADFSRCIYTPDG